jgi:hypothetical protein
VEIIPRFLPVRFEIEEEPGGAVAIRASR